jgi:ABC-type phosphate/phosphonate transport system permease subunit
MTVPDLGIRPDAIERPKDPIGPKLFRWAILIAIVIPAIWSASGLNIDWASTNPFNSNPTLTPWSDFTWSPPNFLPTMLMYVIPTLLAVAAVAWFTRKPTATIGIGLAVAVFLIFWRPVDWSIDFSWSWSYLILVAAVGLIVYWLSNRVTWSVFAALIVLVMPWINFWNPDFFWFDIWRIVHRLAPPDLSADAVQRAMPKVMESIFIAWIGTMIGAAISFPLAFLAAKNMTPAWVNTGIRQVMNGIRAIPELLVAMVLIPITGLGAWTGTLALGLHSIGTLGKLSSEVVEGIDGGPVCSPRCSRRSWPIGSTGSRSTSALPPCSASSERAASAPS